MDLLEEGERCSPSHKDFPLVGWNPPGRLGAPMLAFVASHSLECEAEEERLPLLPASEPGFAHALGCEAEGQRLALSTTSELGFPFPLGAILLMRLLPVLALERRDFA